MPASQSTPGAKSPELLAEPHTVGKAGAAAKSANKVAAKAAKPPAGAGAKPQARTAAQAEPSNKPRKMACIRHHPRILAEAPHRDRRQTRSTRQAQMSVARPEIRPHSGPAYEAPNAPPALAFGCDEACQYRDWLNRYAAWYRDFGRYYYYYGAPPAGMAAPVRPPAFYSENRPPPAPSPQNGRPDQTERDRLDPWHGYNSHSPDNGY